VADLLVRLYGLPHFEAEERVAAAGTELVLAVRGVTCAICVGRVEKALARVDGVKEASECFATERATITYEPSRATPAVFAGAVRDAGYTVPLPARRESVLHLAIAGMTCAIVPWASLRSRPPVSERLTSATVSSAVLSSARIFTPSASEISAHDA